MTFKEWWESPANPARNMPPTTQEQMRWHMAQAWTAGAKYGLANSAKSTIDAIEEIFK